MFWAKKRGSLGMYRIGELSLPSAQNLGVDNRHCVPAQCVQAPSSSGSILILPVFQLSSPLHSLSPQILLSFPCFLLNTLYFCPFSLFFLIYLLFTKWQFYTLCPKLIILQMYHSNIISSIQNLRKTVWIWMTQQPVTTEVYHVKKFIIHSETFGLTWWYFLMIKIFSSSL